MSCRIPGVSVVICTYNRCCKLGVALDALLAQDAGVPYEVLVVDNNSTDETHAVVAERQRQFPRLHYVFEARQGLPYARNAGIRAARAAVIAFTDDDVVVGPEWVGTIASAFEEHPEIDMIGGRVRPVWPREVPQWVTRIQLGPFALGERGDAPIRVSADNAAPCLVGANFAFRREVFERIGLFDPEYTKSQDREIQLRLWRAGGVGLYLPSLAIRVEVPPERLTKRYFRYWYTTYGVYHARMRLLESIDREGRLTDARGPRLFGAPGFLYRQLLHHAIRGVAALIRFDRTAAFYRENRVRYLFSYLRERHRRYAASGQRRSALSEVRCFLTTHRHGGQRPAA